MVGGFLVGVWRVLVGVRRIFGSVFFRIGGEWWGSLVVICFLKC